MAEDLHGVHINKLLNQSYTATDFSNTSPLIRFWKKNQPYDYFNLHVIQYQRVFPPFIGLKLDSDTTSDAIAEIN